MGRFDIATNRIPVVSEDQERVVKEIPRARPPDSYGNDEEPPEVSQSAASRFFLFQMPNGIRLMIPTNHISVAVNGDVLEIRGLSNQAMNSILQNCSPSPTGNATNATTNAMMGWYSSFRNSRRTRGPQ